jgi:POT family proton-dependent oligopeptide transporter
MNPTSAPVPATGEWLGHPKGLFVCFATEMWERFAFYGMKALLMLYLVKHHAFNDADGYILLGTYAGLAYALPLLGGLLADRYLGMRKAVVFGGLLLVLGSTGHGLDRRSRRREPVTAACWAKTHWRFRSCMHHWP